MSGNTISDMSTNTDLSVDSRIPQQRKNSFWQKLGGGSLTMSIIFHGILLAVFAVWIIRIIPQPEKTVDFMRSGGGGGSPAPSERTMQKQNAAISKPTMSRISVPGAPSSITLPEMDDSQSLLSLGGMSSTMAGGFGTSAGGRGNGSSKGFGDGPGIGGGLGDGTANPFGILEGTGVSGTFYDFKRDKSGDPPKERNVMSYTDIIKEFCSGMQWGPPRKTDPFVSKTKLIAKAFAYPGIPDTDAGKAFNSPETKPGMWVAHYTGDVTFNGKSGRYRLIGWGDNCLVIGFNGRIALDASDHNYTGKKREDLGLINVKGKASAVFVRGDWIDLKFGQTVRLDVLIGDQGGIFSAGAFIESEDGKPYQLESGIPKLPMLAVTPLSDTDKQIYDFLPTEATKGSLIFTAKKSAF